MFASILAWAERPIPRPVLLFGLPALYVLLTLVFVLWLFPYDHLAGSFTSQIEAATGMHIEVDELSPRMSLFGPGFEAHDVVVQPPRQRPVKLDRAFVRPAWSTSWLMGNPSLYIDAEGPLGNAKGSLALGSAWGFHGTLDGIDLTALPIDRFMSGASLQGKLTADVDVDLGDDGPDGDLQFVILDGALGLPGSPFGLPFETLSGALDFGGENAVQVERLELDGPMLSAVATGTIGQGERGLELAPLNLEVDLQVRDDVARSALRGLGIRAGDSGDAKIQVSGSLSRPVVR